METAKAEPISEMSGRGTTNVRAVREAGNFLESSSAAALLGIKGTMSEAERHVLKQRMIQGKLTKARRGELGMTVPIGYLRRRSGEVIKDPDEQVQKTVALVFAQYEARGTVHGVLRYLVDHGILMPVRENSGASKGDLRWHRPNRVTLLNMLHHPIYAGAYVYGRRPTDSQRKQPGRIGTGRKVAAIGKWQVILKDKLPAYISWEQYEAIHEQLVANRYRAVSTTRRNPTLLTGLLICGRCGRKLVPQYGSGYARYNCVRNAVDYGGKLCVSVAARVVDASVIALVFRALESSGFEASLHAVALEDRLVADAMKRQPEGELATQHQEEYRLLRAEQSSVLTSAERSAIQTLSCNIPVLWNATTISTAERQMIVRQLIERVELHLDGESERGKLVVHWVGGRCSIEPFIRPVARTEQLSYYRKLVSCIVALRDQGLTSERIAEHLNKEGWRPPKRRLTFNGQMVRTIMSRNGLTKLGGRSNAESNRTLLRQDEWLLSDLARELDMAYVTLCAWLNRGWVQGRRLTEHVRRPWAIRADTKELARLRALRAAPRLGRRSPQWLASA